MKQKVYYITVTVILLFVIVLVLYIIKIMIHTEHTLIIPHKTTIAKANSQNAAYKPYPNFNSITDSSLPSSPSNWDVGENQNYIIKFPDAMKPTTIGVLGGGSDTIFNLAGTSEYPEFTVIVGPEDSANAVQDRVNAIKTLAPDNLSQSQTTFRGLPATQVSEILPIKDAQGNRLHKTFLVFTHNSNLYVVDFAYFQDQAVSNNETVLLQMLNSIALK